MGELCRRDGVGMKETNGEQLLALDFHSVLLVRLLQMFLLGMILTYCSLANKEEQIDGLIGL
jgi:hypothetical protein